MCPAEDMIHPLGDAALAVEFGQSIDPEINDQVRTLHEDLQANPLLGVVETVPTYRSLVVYYRPDLIGWEGIHRALCQRLQGMAHTSPAPGGTVEIPVLYGGGEGPDLPFVAQHAGLEEEDVIRIHSQGIYRVYMLGFSPGFPYLGGMDSRIAAPRLETPRLQIPAGSVGIAGEQTGVYPLASPGGWRLIGRTPLRLYDPQRPHPILLRAGCSLRFRPVTREEFDQIAREEGQDESSC